MLFNLLYCMQLLNPLLALLVTIQLVIELYQMCVTSYFYSTAVHLSDWQKENVTVFC